MEILSAHTPPAQGISPADALWTLIQKASKTTRRTIAERLIASDMEMSEQLLLKASIKRGWEEVKAMQQTATPTYTLQNLIDELKTD